MRTQTKKPIARRSLGMLTAGLLVMAGAGPASAQLFINEIFFDPPGALDISQEFIEVRGEPNASLAGHFLVFLESERSGDQGGVDNLFDLGAFSLGSNGFLTLQQAPEGNPVVPGGTLPQIPIDPAATSLVNSGPGIGIFNSPPGFGNGPASTIGASDDDGEGQIENGAFSALLVRNDTGVDLTLDTDFDADNDGNLDQFVFDNFTILDSVGSAQPDELDPVFYAAVNFAFSAANSATVTNGGQIEFLPFEVEYLGRFGNSTGQTPDDFLATNLTDSTNSGFTAIPDFRVSSSDPQPSAGFGDVDGDGVVESPPGSLPAGGFLEANQDIPFGLPILNTGGAPNFLTGDYNGDGVVDAADYTVWRDTFGQTGTQTNPLAADHNRDFIVDEGDFLLFVENFGAPFGAATPSPLLPPPPASAAIPEPSGLILAAGCLALATPLARPGRRNR